MNEEFVKVIQSWKAMSEPVQLIKQDRSEIKEWVAYLKVSEILGWYTY